ncbi:SPOR domain-containing protein [Paracoccus sp. SCSIO 75233]|uniref:SPOR domain-containing protein n=1 Tax=Paracoccus sp. SCSIO 75233 TaxID=3017782 RepID=UPI0022F00210|nr:SPOR domain-containing protein [Paracoccus sp. SCSIO 75233]WBU52524.1 SPOR domain-containing protein [Paracoccus sp. SCSIO 75233]
MFLRNGHSWTARMDDYDMPICGFPPSLVANAGAEDVGDEPDGLADVIAEAEREIAAALYDGPEPAVVADDAEPRPSEKRDRRKTTGTAQRQAVLKGLTAEITEAIEVAKAVEIRPALPGSADRLCGLLGLQAAGSGHGLGFTDPTGGFCAGGEAMPSDGLSSFAAAAARPQGMREVKRISPNLAAAAPSAVRRPPVKPGVSDRRRVSKGNATDNRNTHRRTARIAPPETVERIPAHARYIQIGRFEAAGVRIAANALMKLGYPVVRQRIDDPEEKRAVMAGPFQSRERLIAALNRLRRAGYRNAVAR